jgi:3-deoxy-D-manno-octulosonate 8-phosphate phosphatase (KDO 8-P phosphatase)
MEGFKNLIIDVDGCLTDGGFYYTSEGKVMKRFGADDADALNLIKDKMNILTISGDKRGLEITKKRIKDMGLKLEFVSPLKRVEWIRERFNLKETIYMGDGIFDSLVFKEVGYSIAPANSFENTLKNANYITKRRGGDGAVAEAVVHILNL